MNAAATSIMNSTATTIMNTTVTSIARLALASAALLVATYAPSCVAGQSTQTTFASAEEASQALFLAVRSQDEAALTDILQEGNSPGSVEDQLQDRLERERFVQKYQEMHRLVHEPDGTTTLYIGARNWPTPIPLVNKGSSWYFDTEVAKKEILYRRIGRNELSAIRVCQELVAAENEYRHTQHDEYTERIVSDTGQHNGLYWKAAVGEPESPIGPLVASAVAEGYAGRNALTPYRGYYFHILSLQGKNGPGGAKSYIINGKMTEGFAFVAFPAQYRVSGVMSFIVGNDGVVYEKDLGTETRVVANGMKKYDPDATWHKAEEAQASVSEAETK
jgi:hypothetical protein